MLRRLVRLGLTLALTVTTAGGAVAVSSPAQAALPHCNGAGVYTSTWSGARGATAWIPAYITNTFSFNCLLTRGDHNSGVGELQRTLQGIYSRNLGPSGVDNDFGGYTQSALRSVQSDLGISADGEYGPQTRDHMCWRWTGSDNSCIWLNNNH
ncbi:peptidoglycan-binding domain-containing protein [Micromonospora sp. WMMD998]|uniref:peptidoglycan-binding domain-containing protein n=1 Tax=Micromonospora sp. WMMD998 TaxID=3016092 RepID=UPI00249AE9A4|nr:peptidoglycan-binding domain-containing protein [Micromonospora sp. WMMD998]WFE39137.1 peptidoglycan-binding domain-containing protein [Micromonospora sp. WMMD998]